MLFAELPEQLPDGGPSYFETPPLDSDRWIREPWNAVSALLFLVIVAYWVVRLRGKYQQHPFLCCCLPLLAAGGVGGSLYHALRSSMFFFLLDVVPIFLLCLAASLYLWYRLGARWWHLVPLLLAFLLPNLLLGTQNRALAINVSYAVLAALILLPVVVVLARMRYRHMQWIVLALLSFLVALFFRYADGAIRPSLLPMGTHWLWHTFGAGATAALAEYVYHLEAEPVRPSSIRSPLPGDN
jgi:hypothetical protein